MASAMPSSPALADARDVIDLVGRARTLGLSQVLEQPLETLYELPGIDPRAAELLDEIGALGIFPTIESLAIDPRVTVLVRRAGNKEKRGLLQAVAAYLAGAAPKGHTLARVQAWAREHDVASLLDLPLRTLEPFVEWQDRRWLYQFPGRTLASLFDDSLPAGAAKGLATLQKAARSFLVRRAKEMDAVQAEERARLAMPPPEDPVARALYDRVRAARARVREKVSPRGPFSRDARIEVQFVPDPPLWLLTEDTWPHKVETIVPLQEGRPGEPLVATCNCSLLPCAHALTALDLLLELLADPRRRADAAPVLAELARSPWERALADLERGGAAATTEDAERLGWRIGRVVHQLTLAPVLQRRGKRGFSSGSKVRIADLVRRMPESASPGDREAILLLWASEHERDGTSIVPRAIRALIGHQAVTLADAPGQPVTVRPGRLAFVARDEDGGAVVLEPTVDGQPVDARALVANGGIEDVACVLDARGTTCVVVSVDAGARDLLAVLASRGGYFPAPAVPALAQRLPALGQRVALSLPPSLRGAEVAADERPLLRLTALPGVGLRVDARARPLPEGPAYPPGQGPREVAGTRAGERVYAVRDLATEPPRIRAALAVLPLRSDAETEPFAWQCDQGEDGLDLLAALHDERAAFVVEWSGEPRTVAWADVATLRVRVEDRRDWFGVDGAVEIGGARVPLDVLLAAVRGRRRYVEVNGGLWLRIAEELRARLAPAADHAVAGRHGLEVSRLGAPALADLLGDETAGPPRLRELCARIRAAGASEPGLPAELAPVLRDYQAAGYRWLSRLAAWGLGGCLADDMGLGKTVQALALLVTRAELGPALVVAPTSVGWNWVNEARRFAPSLNVVLHRETDRAEALARLGAGDVLVTSYGLLVREAEALAEPRFATLILDEAQAIKNPATQRARAAATLKADFRLALSGTPIENRLAELWSLFRVVAPGLLGSWDSFRERFAVPIERDRATHRQEALARLLRPFILRRLKSDVAPELPARIEIRQDVELSPAERSLYDELRLAIVAELAAPARTVTAAQRRIQVLAGMTRLRQLACDPRLVHPDTLVGSSKLERCLELVDELREGGHRALIFSQFTSNLALVREALEAAEVSSLYLDGQTPAVRREELVGAFQRGEGDVFLISLKAGGTGLNLTAADVVIHLDPWWNPAVEDQASDRAHRIGQERPVTIYRLVARGTIEEAILDLHDEKRRLVAGLLDGTGAAASLGTDELIRLIESSGKELSPASRRRP